jgi:Metallo-beta-lactamase superfamily
VVPPNQAHSFVNSGSEPLRQIDTHVSSSFSTEWLENREGKEQMAENEPMTAARFEAELGGLYASAPEPLPFAPSLHIHTLLLRRDPGNLLVYSVPGLSAAASAIDGLGGVGRQYLSHWHEAMFASDRLAAPLFVHESDRDEVAQRTGVGGTFTDRHTLDGDFEVIPTPGHTPGATAYLWNSGQHRFLFTGDTIYLSKGEWVAAVLDSSDRGAYIDSLELIRDLDFDVLVSWAATAGKSYYAITSRCDSRRRIDEILERVRRGEAR